MTPQFGAWNSEASNGGSLPSRVISSRAMRMLRKIHRKAPDWDNWSVEAEIWFKAYQMGITEEE